MSESSKMNFHELMSLYKGYNDTIDALYRLRTTNEEILDKICNDIKNNLIDTKYLLPSYILDTISFASRCNNRYLKSYWYIFKKIYEEYRPDHINDFLYGFDYFVYKEYGIWLNEENKISPERIESENFSLEVVKSDTIFESIMNDNIETFTSFTEREEFDKNEVLVSPFFIDTTKPSLLEVCCYYGATKCFSLLREKFNSEITKRCLQFSILNGNFGLVKECLKAIEPDKECMEYAILSHNIALVTFFMIEYKLTIEVFRCGEYHNLQAFFVYLDQTNDIKKCFIYSPVFNIPSLCKYFLSQGANIYDRSPTNKQTALHIAAYLNAVESAKFLITNDAAINKKILMETHLYSLQQNIIQRK
ncbi:hypothetical protein TVAG_038890 [Trichomonas vaginalis G3]|uniref:DUF3447 domain-containing protein n=1 Tax=Trichomonas vaginalis (strain ATCC PRA-98 / G3) TaxID=412133 RepID=A2E5K1_TRIV3|nr:protein of unknown function (DUF3447) [Trichomonas vaginalis G3]EAY12042.1 hypothetical protein TVAG_038890 [Trichomonas vaginalis G3]KAI5553274.1 protein of unknown function (DUF3447) [Trichomonas vaginalis G3]|eukprot:XP_001324265.1 hypothetical protein [Trichomonas vaginalis G3]